MKRRLTPLMAMRRMTTVRSGRAPTGRAALVAVTVAWAGGLLYLGLMPRVPEAGPLDKDTLSSWGHALGTLVLAALLYLNILGFSQGSRRTTGVVAALTASLFGIGIELLQSLTGDREPSVADALLNAAGAVIAVAFLSRRRVSVPAWSRAMTWTTPILLVAVVPAAVLAAPDSDDRCSTSNAPRPTLRASTPEAAEPEPIARYLFDEGAGRRVADVSGVSPALDLRLVGPGVAWLDGGGLRFSGGAARSVGAATKLVEATQHTGEVTVEAWVRSDRLDQDGPARIATVSSGTERDEVDLHLAQHGPALSVRVRATCGPFNWTTFPHVFTSETSALHVALTFANRVS
ncbi:MAG: VanZ family protein, partial [Acidimicrobiales bacterium]